MAKDEEVEWRRMRRLNGEGYIASIKRPLTDNKQSESSGLDGLKGDIIVMILQWIPLYSCYFQWWHIFHRVIAVIG